MSYDLEFKTVQIAVKESKLWVNIPQCILRIGGLDPDWIHKLSIYKPENDIMNQLSPQYEPTTANMGDMIDIRIPKPTPINCSQYDCLHVTAFPMGICRSVPDLKLVKQGLFQCKNFKEIV